jgi:hypothetical protein
MERQRLTDCGTASTPWLKTTLSQISVDGVEVPGAC